MSHQLCIELNDAVKNERKGEVSLLLEKIFQTISSIDEREVRQEKRKLLTNHGLVLLLLSILKDHERCSQAVAENALKLLASLSVDETAANQVMSSGGMSVLTHFLSINSSPVCAEFATLALSILVSSGNQV